MWGGAAGWMQKLLPAVQSVNEHHQHASSSSIYRHGHLWGRLQLQHRINTDELKASNEGSGTFLCSVHFKTHHKGELRQIHSVRPSYDSTEVRSPQRPDFVPMATTVQWPGFIHKSNNYKGKKIIITSVHMLHLALARLGIFKMKEKKKKKKEKLNTDKHNRIVALMSNKDLGLYLNRVK